MGVVYWSPTAKTTIRSTPRIRWADQLAVPMQVVRGATLGGRVGVAVWVPIIHPCGVPELYRWP